MDCARWFHHGIGPSRVGDNKTGSWEYYLGKEGPISDYVARFYLRNASFTSEEADDYLAALRYEFLHPKGY